MNTVRSLDAIAQRVGDTPSFRRVVDRLRARTGPVWYRRLSGSLGAFLVAHAHRALGQPVLVITPDEDGAEQWRDDLQAILGTDAVRYFPAWDVDVYDRRSPDSEITALRVEAAARLQQHGPALMVAPVAALLTPLIPPHALELATLHVRAGAAQDLGQLATHLTECGFERVPMVEAAGEFSVRGGIVDVFPYGTDQPFRLDFFGDQIESIRRFDVATQRSLGKIDAAWLLPAREVILGPDFAGEYAANLRAVPAELASAARVYQDQLELGGALEGIEAAMPLLYGRDDGLFEYLRDAILVAGETEELAAAATAALQRPNREYERHRERGTHLPPHLLLRDAAWLERMLAGRTRLQPAPVGALDQAVDFGAAESFPIHGELGVLRREVERLDEEGYAIHLRCETQGQSARLQEIVAPWSDQVAVGLGSLHRGFVYPEARLALLNDHEIFSRQKHRYRYRKFQSATPLASRTALQRGDFVVHVDHGIGRYLGIQRLRVGGVEHECLTVGYQGSDRLFVPVEQLDRLRKYASAEGEVPQLSKLGGTAWEKLKERTREEIFKMASELVQLYAARRALPGFAFSPDGPLHRVVEASFPYQETPDQLRTMEEVRQDMESPTCMDRLVCGDVGYGKTEVAVRGAFKAVCDHKQVAVLVPTTILAAQHHHTFTERLAGTPVRVEVLSRFRSGKALQSILHDVRTGRVDILIGTHRLLSKDVVFRDLGLLIVDEEQRFGVRHKEHLKKLRRLVDVLTLTATPIPRTLHMSLMGARDMSVINTPPQDRLPIHTEIIPFDANRIAQAIQREVERGGQVYFVHNRVQSIQRLAGYVRELVPHVRVAVAHGQMPPRQLERIMLDFLERRYDCLVCTMIIESGIDIPSVNTLLVNRADTLGLSQLYQIRGRVGRAKERAYAYLLVPKGKKLTKRSRMRLRAIEEFADLGSGFNIAMRDMEIRGAGNLLGAQQHGFIAAVGFDLYCRLLEEAMRELKGEAVPEAVEPDVKIPVSAYIPDEYVPDTDQKMEFYQRLADAQRVVELLAIREELEDRFGRLPLPARALLCIMEVRVMARQLGLSAVRLERQALRLTFPPTRQLDRDDIQRLVQKCPARLEFRLGEQVSVEVRVQGGDEIERLERARDALEAIL